MNVTTVNNATDSDLDSIRAAAMDYAEGWYTGDAVRMERALHASLMKRTIIRDDQGGWTVNSPSTFDAMVSWTDEGGGTAWQGEESYEVQVLDVFRDIASVRCLSPEYVDLLHLARFGADGWKIVNVLWQLREGNYEPGG